MPDSERLSGIAEILGRGGLLIWNPRRGALMGSPSRLVSRCEPNVRRGLERELQAELHGTHLRTIGDVGDASAITAVYAGSR
jgi:hypothetical protein